MNAIAMNLDSGLRIAYRAFAGCQLLAVHAASRLRTAERLRQRSLALGLRMEVIESIQHTSKYARACTPCHPPYRSRIAVYSAVRLQLAQASFRERTVGIIATITLRSLRSDRMSRNVTNDVAEPCAAANCSGRHAGCCRPSRRLRPSCPRPPSPAASAPPSAVAELGVVRRYCSRLCECRFQGFLRHRLRAKSSSLVPTRTALAS